ncbi:MAG: acetylornithine carbamoyltransferase [Ignavibacteria bacterium]|nr:acetylornithine carbamoyltransferase [Ignavibacteria bacterium]
MNSFTSVTDVVNPRALVESALQIKKLPYAYATLGTNKTIGLFFFNSSLRTRISTQKAAMNLGMNSIVMNVGAEGWMLEFADGAVMNGSAVEHVKDAAAVMSLYCDVIAVRSFPTLTNKTEDYQELVLSQFVTYATVPVVSMESATRHPLQSLADVMTMKESQRSSHPSQRTSQPKVVLTWAPHIKALPQAVANSFAEWTLALKYDLTITHPEGYELNTDFTEGATIEHDQHKALEGADFVYVKNWSAYTDYGAVLTTDPSWMLDEQKLQHATNARIMHCLPVRRNVELSDELIDGPRSLIYTQAENRVYAAQAVLKEILESS